MARTPRVTKEQLGGFASIREAYNEMEPNVSYHGFRQRIVAGKNVLEAGTAPRSTRGRPTNAELAHMAAEAELDDAYREHQS